jgi:uncharacterized protein (TIGR02466 family)
VSKLLSLFPTAVLQGDLGRSITKTEIDFIKGLDKDKNIGNKTSHNRYILKEKVLSKLQKDLYKTISEYANSVITASDEINFVITQSWVSYTENGEFHHSHNHPNSYLSGILYIDTVETDTITFDNPRVNQIQIYPTSYNIFNSNSWTLPTKVGEILIFPSHVFHMVENRESGEDTRISLPFNIMPRGVLGSYQDINELVL